MRRGLTAVLLLFLASPVFAQDAPSRGWIDVNFVGLQSTQDEQTYTWRTTLFRETATATSAYPALPIAKGAEVAGGFNFYPQIGVGAHFNVVNYEYTVGLAVSVPHPLIFNRPGSDIDVTNSSLERNDRSIDLFAAYTAPTTDAIQVRVFGGPTYFSVSQQMVEIIRYNQLFNLLGANIVDITTFTQLEVEESAWGFNVGADAAYFFSRHVGVGGVVRFNQGTVNIDKEPLTGQPAELKVGSTSFGGGLRLRF